MSDGSKIEWLAWPGTKPATWNPIAGCSKCATGCKSCYAIRQAHRMAGNPNPKISDRYRGLTVIQNGKPNWTGVVRFGDLDVLAQPLRWRQPRTIFISLSDLFHEGFAFAEIDLVFAVAALTRQHKYIFLTKRGRRMWEYFENRPRVFTEGNMQRSMPGFLARRLLAMLYGTPDQNRNWVDGQWPLPNVILGVSASTQADVDEQVPELLRTPAACRLLSLEPQVEDVDVAPYLRPHWTTLPGAHSPPWLNWVIQGGESGHNARPFCLRWARKTRDQCAVAGITYFLKQIGSVPVGQEIPHFPAHMHNRKGGDPSEWPADLRNCRAFPEVPIAA